MFKLLELESIGLRTRSAPIKITYNIGWSINSSILRCYWKTKHCQNHLRFINVDYKRAYLCKIRRILSVYGYLNIVANTEQCDARAANGNVAAKNALSILSVALTHLVFTANWTRSLYTSNARRALTVISDDFWLHACTTCNSCARLCADSRHYLGDAPINLPSDLE